MIGRSVYSPPIVPTKSSPDPVVPHSDSQPQEEVVPRSLVRAWMPWLLLILVSASLFLRLLWIAKPEGALIFDETYYVNAARVILGLPVAESAPYATARPGLDPNTEHPPLGKLLIAGTMRLFGNTARGWRLASVLFGTLSIPLLYAVARRVGIAPEPAFLATFLYAFDNLVFVHSRIGTLDIFVVAFLLLGLYCYLAERPILAGLAIALATLCKIGGIYGIGVIVLLESCRLLRARFSDGRWSLAPLRPLLIATAVYVVALLGLLALLDSRWSTYKNPIAHLEHIFRYGFALVRPGGPQGQESAPWQWLINEVQMTYLRTDVQLASDGAVRETRAAIYFRGAMNPFVIFSAPLGIVYAAERAWRRREDWSFLTVAFFVATYVPFWPAAILAHRISYIFYFLPAIPAVALGTANLLYDPALPRPVRWAFIGAVLLGFYGYFPFRMIPR